MQVRRVIAAGNRVERNRSPIGRGFPRGQDPGIDDGAATDQALQPRVYHPDDHVAFRFRVFENAPDNRGRFVAAPAQVVYETGGGLRRQGDQQSPGGLRIIENGRLGRVGIVLQLDLGHRISLVAV
ncbi:MAG: hypothetical protein BWY09_00873 [Candidatus Hydrogenedentes bacterium ADurb.Bin179]|nr:MAG: hypothetical protein BWY09_00873 [Candidatus Hydrogenedentes bacterium ADurb.Bin179]